MCTAFPIRRRHIKEAKTQVSHHPSILQSPTVSAVGPIPASTRVSTRKTSFPCNTLHSQTILLYKNTFLLNSPASLLHSLVYILSKLAPHNKLCLDSLLFLFITSYFVHQTSNISLYTPYFILKTTYFILHTSNFLIYAPYFIIHTPYTIIHRIYTYNP